MAKRDTTPELKEKINTILSEMEVLYLADDKPWIIGLSGGKDSTAITQLAYKMLINLPTEKRNKKIWVVSSDTLVDTPISNKRQRDLCSMIANQAKIDKIPLEVKIIKPELDATFWVNLIGRGYPAPNRNFRWCTDRLKIRPMTIFVTEKVKENGEVFILLGIRKEESQTRGRTIEKYNISGTKLSQHNDVKGALIYAPIQEWGEEDVWNFILKSESPWGDDNKFLLKCYSRGEGDADFIVSKDQDATGATRMGCWVCTVVKHDKSIMSYIDEGETWLTPLKEFRDEIFEMRDRKECRSEWRKDEVKKKIYADILGREYEGLVRFGHKVYGPFTFKARHYILKKLIGLQTNPSPLKEKLDEQSIKLISPEEIQAIVKLWIYEGDDINKINELLKECGAGDSYIDHLLGIDNEKYQTRLESICKENNVPLDLIDKLLFVEKDMSALSRRVGIFNKLDGIIENYVLDEMKKENEVKNEDLRA